MTVKFYLAPGLRNRKFYLAPGMRNGKIYLAPNHSYEKLYLAVKGLSRERFHFLASALACNISFEKIIFCLLSFLNNFWTDNESHILSLFRNLYKFKLDSFCNQLLSLTHNSVLQNCDAKVHA